MPIPLCYEFSDPPFSLHFSFVLLFALPTMSLMFLVFIVSKLCCRPLCIGISTSRRHNAGRRNFHSPLNTFQKIMLITIKYKKKQ
jgi:hypothetical protein